MRKKKPLIGRPPLAGGKTSPVAVLLTVNHLAIAKRLGEGNVSKGVRVALETAENKC